MKRNNNNKKYGYEQQQKQVNLVAHDKILVFENFRYLMEGLEEYIEKSGYYPNFKSKRQLQNITVPREKKLSIKNCEELFRTRLLLFFGVLGNDTPDSTRKEVQEEYYKWINMVGIDANNCLDEKLKHFLVETNNVIEGKSDKIVSQTQEYLDGNPIDLTDPNEVGSLIKVFSSVQGPMDEKREQARLYEGKNYFQVEVENKFDGGNTQQGEQVFNQLAGSVAGHHKDFSFFSQQGQRSNNSQQRTNFEIIQDVKINPQSWSINEVINGYDVFNKPKKENALIHNSAEVGFNGAVSNWQQPIYLATRFNQAEIAEIKRALNIAEDDENRQIIESIKSDLSSWKIKLVHGNNWLVHKQAREVESEVGHLLHPKQRFTDEEWTEIENALNSHQSWGSRIVSNILPNNYGNRQGYKLEVDQFTSSAFQKDDKDIGSGGIFAIVVIASILLVASVVVIKKRLNRKVKSR